MTSWLMAVSGLAETWAAHALNALVQGSLMLAVVALVWWPLRRRMSPQFGYALFLLVPLKLVLAVELPLPAQVARFVPTTWASRVVEQVSHDLAAAPVRATAPLSPPASPATLREVEGLLAQLRRPAPAAAPRERMEPVEPPLSAGAPALPAPAPPDPVVPSALARWFAAVPPATLAMFVWLLGASALLVRFARAQLRLRRVLRTATLLDLRHLPLDYAALAHRAGLRRVPPLYESPAFAAPALAGLLRPRLVLPAGLARRLDPAQLSWALCHEFAHLRRADLWVALGQRLVQIVYFFHPAVWLAHAAADRYREYACDDAALLACGTSRRACGESFLTIVEQASRWHGARGPSSAAALAGMTVRKQTIRSRLMRILDKNRDPRRGMTRAGYLMVGAAALVLLPSVRAQQEPPPEPIDPIEPIEIVFEEPEPLEFVVEPFEQPEPLEFVFEEQEPL
ncbi:MAG TPA: M56 family metallopeptidase, partial [Planctomycetota bacterium]